MKNKGLKRFLKKFIENKTENDCGLDLAKQLLSILCEMDQRICVNCGKKLDIIENKRGRPRKYCDECRPQITKINNHYWYEKSTKIKRGYKRHHKICRKCGKPFETNYSRKAYCSLECVPKKRRVVEKQCLCCGKTFVTNIDRNIYCSKTCKYKYWGETRKEERRKEREEKNA